MPTKFEHVFWGWWSPCTVRSALNEQVWTCQGEGEGPVQRGGSCMMPVNRKTDRQTHDWRHYLAAISLFMGSFSSSGRENAEQRVVWQIRFDYKRIIWKLCRRMVSVWICVYKLSRNAIACLHKKSVKCTSYSIQPQEPFPTSISGTEQGGCY